MLLDLTDVQSLTILDITPATDVTRCDTIPGYGLPPPPNTALRDMTPAFYITGCDPSINITPAIETRYDPPVTDTTG